MSPRRWTLVAVVIGSGVVFLDGTVVNVALDTIGRELPAVFVGRLEGLTYVTAAYLTVLAALLVLAGALGDRYGRRRVFAIGLAGFGVASVACGLAPTLDALVVARLAQGAAGALLVPGSLAIITATWEGEERGRAIGIWAAATSAFTLVGPLVGGLLVQVGVLARRLPGQRAARRPRRLRAAPRAGVARRARLGPVRLARCRGARRRRRRARLRGDARPAAGLVGPRGLRGDRPRARGDRRVPVPDGPTAVPAGPARDLPVPHVQRGQRRHVRDLRRPVREHGAPAAVPAGRPRLLADGGRAGDDAAGDPARAPLDALRPARRTTRIAAAADPGPGADGGGRPPPRPRPERQRWVAGRARPTRRRSSPRPATSWTSCPRSSSTGWAWR